MDPTATPTPTPTPSVDPTTVPVPTGTAAPMEVALTGTQWDLILLALVFVVFVAGFILVVKL